MLNFGIKFLLCNIFIAIFIGIISISKRIFRKHLTERAQYNLGLVLFLLLAIPFLPLRPIGFSQVLSLFEFLANPLAHSSNVLTHNTTSKGSFSALDCINDYTTSVDSTTPSFINIILLSLWILGIFVMLLFTIRSLTHIFKIRNSALPLQNRQVLKIYHQCLDELKIDRKIPIYSTMFLKSPISMGLIHPQIYLPIHLISDLNKTDMRYMLLHELQHYRYKDALINYFTILFEILYWFNPFVWYALKELQLEREIACDSSVLQLLDESDYERYGNTLINFAEKISFSPFSFATGIGGSMEQLTRRITNIATYQTKTLSQNIKSTAVYIIISIVILGMAPVLSIYATEQDNYQFNVAADKITSLNLSAAFGNYDGCFVLYDESSDHWKIYNEKNAIKRITPNSTYKIYDALLGLENGIITPDDSLMRWDGKNYPFKAWETNQNLNSAMIYSVNWYFQSIDKKSGFNTVKSFFHKIGYGNETIGNDLDMYWNESALKISAIEQVELLRKLYHNDFGFSIQNINAVKDAICLSSTDIFSLYGKTGTSRVEENDINGWFIGYVEENGKVYYFATNIQGNANATGSKATEITEYILSTLGIYE